jgi:Trk K+ transport system NAD-binding subunit
VNNPKNEAAVRHLGVDELVSPTRMILGSIEQDIPVHELLHLAALGEGELELIEPTCRRVRRPSAGRQPSSTSRRLFLFAVIREGIASPLRPDTVLREATRSSPTASRNASTSSAAQLIGDPEAPPQAESRPEATRGPLDTSPDCQDFIHRYAQNS